MSAEVETIILGGGLTGLSLAQYLEGETLVLEAKDRPGGLCRSFVKDGFTYDIGGHILFSRDSELLAQLTGWLGGNLLEQRRNNQIWFQDRFVKYPFENGLYALEKQDIFECLLGFVERSGGDPANLEQWCRFRFGDAIADKYLIPYNDKIWKRPAKDISVHWVERIPSPPTADVIKAAIGIETEGYTHQLNFLYPERGGIEALIHALAKGVNLQTGFRAQSIKKTSSGWQVSDGDQTCSCRRLISTIPVMDLAACLDGAPGDARAACDALQYNSIILVMLGVGHEGLNDKSAVYIPGPDILPHRVCYMSYFSPHNAPQGSSHLVAEITVPPGDPLLKASEDELVGRVAGQVADLCAITPSEVTASDVQKLKHAYVVYDQGYLANREKVYAWLDGLGLYTCGRFGSFEYLNMDQCLEQARGLAAQLNK
ncbi:MAG: FAD-dependent oxidoreductase [Desulfarculaceae bacterium]|nr:FAD-dependent oxidoreductase [Desulfarculaceae bacterium]MCF8072748.1 FAD-dependent oxidoreductase [Desulfarculaceae bacterium]MCF8100916.1 FAD-dependent oxidoreductase [Desulfarculaceae bacterium]MCF8118562.1 FAD-dependent oxidoreductase [Desulfarculaceae bacterium]